MSIVGDYFFEFPASRGVQGGAIVLMMTVQALSGEVLMIDERLTHEELESLYLAMKSHFEVMAESASEAEVIECSQIVRVLCELQERRTAMLAVAPQEVK